MYIYVFRHVNLTETKTLVARQICNVFGMLLGDYGQMVRYTAIYDLVLSPRGRGGGFDAKRYSRKDTDRQ